MDRAHLAALAAPPEFLLLDKVAAFVDERYAEVVWIRLEAADADPGVLFLALRGALARLDGAAEAEIGDTAARHVSRGDWEQAYRVIGGTLGAVTARPAVVVLEGAEHLETGSPAALDLLLTALLPALRHDLDVLMIGYTEWDRRRLKPSGKVHGPQSLCLDPRAAALVAEALGFDASMVALDRSFAVTGGAAGALQAAYSAGRALGLDVFMTVSADASSGTELLAKLGRKLLACAGEDTLIALAVARRLGVWHPDIATVLGHGTVDRDGPWWLDLAEGWRQLIPAWRTALRSAGETADLDSPSLALLADHLAGQGVADRALELYLDAGEVDRAIDTAVRLAAGLATAGCWASVARLAQNVSRHGSPVPRDSGPGGTTSRPRRTLWRYLSSWLPAGLAGIPSSGAPGTTPAPAVELIPSPRLPDPTAPAAGTAHAPAMPDALAAVTVHLLGELQVAFGGRRIETWVSGRGRAVFEYLVVHRHSRVRRERLMSVFWPEASPAAARNSLNVAVHGLRRSLSRVTGDRPVVIHRDQSYFIEPGLDVWVDVEAFEDYLKSAHQYLVSEDLAKARAALEAAIEFYHGEFLADDPYEEWALVTKEHLRLRYLDSLDQLGRLRFDAGDHSGCVEMCLKLLACDNCREDTH